MRVKRRPKIMFESGNKVNQRVDNVIEPKETKDDRISTRFNVGEN